MDSANQLGGWIRLTLTAKLFSDAHLGSGTGGGGIDALLSRDRNDRPVIWASHLEGILRDAARRLQGDNAAGSFFGHSGGQAQRAIFTSLYADTDVERHIWRSTARESFANRAPKGDTLRVIEHVPTGTTFTGEVELPASQADTLRRLVQEVDALGGGRATGAGRVALSLTEVPSTPIQTTIATGRLKLLLANRDPICVTATATPDNLIPSLSFVPGRALLGAITAWLIDEGHRTTASLLTSGRVSVSDALPLPTAPSNVDDVEVLPAPLSLQSEKPVGSAGEVPWWARSTPQRRVDSWNAEKKLRRPEEDLYAYRGCAGEAWTTFRPARRVRLRNGRPDPTQAEPSLFAIEQIAEETYFLAELRGSQADMEVLADALAPVLEGLRWLRVGRAGAPVEVKQAVWCGPTARAEPSETAILTLTSDLLLRDDQLRWRTMLDTDGLRDLLGADIQIARSLQDAIPVHGFNGTSRLWRMPADAIRRGSVFSISGAGVAKLVARAATGRWLGERTHEGFGRFRIDATLPGVSDGARATTPAATPPDVDEEAVAAKTQAWFNEHSALAKPGSGSDRKPSLSQWLDLVAELERGEATALTARLEPTTAGAKGWRDRHAIAILQRLNDGALPVAQRALYARLFVRWLRAAWRKEAR
jgi:hypothetical protein